MARVLVLSLVFAPDGVSTAYLMTDLSLELRALGHDVTVLTTEPHYNVEPEARSRQPLKRRWGRLLFESSLEGIPVYHASMPRKGNRVGSRLMDYVRFHAISTLAGLALAGQYEVVLAPSPPLTIGIAAGVLARARGAPFIYNVQEIYPDIAVSMGFLRSRWAIRVLEGVERFVYARANAVVVISEGFRRRLLQKGVSPKKLTVIPNFVDIDFMRPIARGNDFSIAHGLNDSFVILYAGNLGLSQGVETILGAARRLTHLSDVRFLIVGDGARRAWLEGQLAEMRLSNVTLLPYQPHSALPQMYASSDICLVPLKRGTAHETFPSKVYTVMAAGRPLIASIDAESDVTWLVKEADCGWSIPPDDESALAAAIVHAYSSRPELRRKGLNGRRYAVSHHSRRSIAAQYDSLIQRLVGSR
jgi:colanic acid biosynthesis glycosyl transferase WcaI